MFIAKTQINPFTPNNVSLSVVNEKNTILLVLMGVLQNVYKSLMSCMKLQIKDFYMAQNAIIKIVIKVDLQVQINVLKFIN